MKMEISEAEADRAHDALFSPDCAVEVEAVRDNPAYGRCPRCWHYHTVKLNYDHLCDRCCIVLMSAWPDHVSVPHIRGNWEAQRKTL